MIHWALRGVLALLFLSPPVRAIDSNSIFVPGDQFMGLASKNDIELAELAKNGGEFELVSVHYRDDKNEIRFTYGNKLAMGGLRSESKKYSAGAVFYKIVYDGERDPAFPSSIVPKSRPKLYQVMLYNAEKYRKTGGWTYAVFAKDGLSLPGDPGQTVQTCLACHQIVAKRNYVFSWPMNLNFFARGNAPFALGENPSKSFSKDHLQELFRLKAVPAKSLPFEIVRMARWHGRTVNLMEGQIVREEFTGFVSEVGSFLVKETIRTGRPSFAIKTVGNEQVFSYAYKDGESKRSCAANESLLRWGGGKISLGSRDKNQYVEFSKCAR